MVWTGSGQYRLAPALLTLLHQLEQANPGQQWVNSPQTGTVGDSAHFAEGSSSDHNPWLDGTVRALDIAANVSDVAGVVAVADAPDCEALFAMVNRMYADRDPRVFPNGYAIYLYRVTDWDNPGGFHAQQGDPHLYHLHISVSQNPAGFNSTAPWPLPTAGESADSGTAHEITPSAPASPVGDGMYEILRNTKSGAVRAAGPNYWVALEGRTAAETLNNITIARTGPLCHNPTVRDVSDPGMAWWKRFYTTGKVS